jgi:hypothetical protein
LTANLRLATVTKRSERPAQMERAAAAGGI